MSRYVKPSWSPLVLSEVWKWFVWWPVTQPPSRSRLLLTNIFELLTSFASFVSAGWLVDAQEVQRSIQGINLNKINTAACRLRGSMQRWIRQCQVVSSDASDLISEILWDAQVVRHAPRPATSQQCCVAQDSPHLSHSFADILWDFMYCVWCPCLFLLKCRCRIWNCRFCKSARIRSFGLETYRGGAQHNRFR